MPRQKGYTGSEDKITCLSDTLDVGGGITFLEINKVGDVSTRRCHFHFPEEMSTGEEGE